MEVITFRNSKTKCISWHLSNCHDIFQSNVDQHDAEEAKIRNFEGKKGFKTFQIKNMSKNIVSNLDFFDLPWHMGQITPFGGNVSKSKLVKITHSCMISGDLG